MPTGHYRFRRSLGNVSSLFRGARPDTYPLFTGLLDSYPGAAAAYSLRALSTGWLAGDVVEVRRSSDSTSQGFTASQITNGDLVTFCGVGDGFVLTWYDQSGNANNLVQPTTTKQTKIVIAGVLVAGGMDFDGVDDGLESINNATISQVFTTIHVSNPAQVSTDAVVAQSSAVSTDWQWGDFYRSAGTVAIASGTTANGAAYSINTDYLKFSVFDNGSSSISLNGSVTSGLTAGTGGGTTKILVGNAKSAGFQFPFHGKIAEVIIYNSDQSANRVAIEANINAAYSIY